MEGSRPGKGQDITSRFEEILAIWANFKNDTYYMTDEGGGRDNRFVY